MGIMGHQVEHKKMGIIQPIKEVIVGLKCHLEQFMIKVHNQRN